MDYKYEDLLQYCKSEKQRIVFDTLIETQSQNATAKILGKSTGTISSCVKTVRKRAAKVGHAPEANLVHAVPEGFGIKRISTFTNSKGESNEWIIKEADKEDMLIQWQEIIAGLADGIAKAPIIKAPDNCNDDLLCDYTIGDAHLGMKAWAFDSDTDWTLQKGVDILRRGIQYLVDSAPSAGTAYILDVGDFIHADNQSNKTNHSGNQLDVDGRWPEIVQAAIFCIYDLIELCLEKHDKVIFRSVIGNHNEQTAITLNMLVSMKYLDNPRVEIFGSPQMHHYYQFGCNLLADTHGHTTKADKLPLLMATDEPMMWATTTNRVWRTGHLHHEVVKEHPGVTVKTLRTLTPKDSWHRASGYRSDREMEMTVYHKDTGRVSSSYVNPTMIGY